MSNSIASIKASTWRSFFLENDKLKYSDSLLQKVRETANFGVAPVARTRRSIESTTKSHKADPLIPWLTDFMHVFHFCYLCSIGKIEPIIYTIPSSSDIIEWHESVELTHLLRPAPSHPTISHMLSASGRSASVDDDELTVESSISLKDRHMIHTLLKISENLDQNTLRLTRESDEKAKGFAKLERHKRLLILNATEHDSTEDSPSKPTEFCRAFLLKSTVYRAKEALRQGLKTSKDIIFIPSTAFAARLYTVDLLWQSPDQPSGISLFYCAESSTPEQDHGYALLEKLDKSDVQRASKQTLDVPLSYSAALWMLKNMRAVMSLYLGHLH
jgi:hypothetical protein